MVAISRFKLGDIYHVGLRMSTQNRNQVSCKSAGIQILDLTNIPVLLLVYHTIVLALASTTGKQTRVKRTTDGRNSAEKVQGR
jgi:hypothetical protein